MELILAKFCKGITGQLYKGCGYTLREHKMPDGKTMIVSQRTAPQSDGPDDRHLTFIETVAHMAVNDGVMMLKDVRVSVRELAAAYNETLIRPRDDAVARMVAFVSLVLRQVKPNTELNARDTINIINSLKTKTL